MGAGARRSRLRDMSPVVFPIVWAVGLLVFSAIVATRARLLLRARPAAGRLDRMPERLRRALVLGVGQRKFLRGEQPAGIMHALIFWGFVVLLLQVVTLFGEAFDEDWRLPGLGAWFTTVADVVAVLVIVAVVYMLYRRLI